MHSFINTIVTKSRFRSLASAAALAAMFGVLGTGCHAPGSVNLLQAGSVRYERAPSRVVELPQPSIWYENNRLEVSGTAKRARMVSGPLAGHIDVTVLSSDGKELEMIPATMAPPWIPSAGPRHSYYAASHYTARSSNRPPEGSVVRVAYRGGSHEDCVAARQRGDAQ